MLVGKYTNTIDAKGRVFLPAKFRSDLGDTVIIVKGAGGCLTLYTEEKFLDYVERLQMDGETESLDDLRFISYGSASVDLDAQGRILIPEELRRYASLDKEVTFVGLMSTVEIWNGDAVEEIVEKKTAEEIKQRMIRNKR